MQAKSSKLLTAFLALLALLAASARDLPAEASASSAADCFSEDNDRRIAGCTEIIGSPGTSPDELSTAYSMRALAYSLKGLYDLAIPDYDAAIRINPNFAVALNNRAWAYYKAGRAREGLPDVEKSLKLSPTSAHAYDTRAHIRQVEGDATGAVADYEMAMRFGGNRMIRLYQCGLKAHGLYFGPVDGIYKRGMRDALIACVDKRDCDPLPADDECRAATS